MDTINLTQYLKLKPFNHIPEPKAGKAKYYLKGCCSAPDVASKVIRLFNVKATVLYFCLCSVENDKTVFDYRFTILYPDGHYEQNNWQYDFETSFEDYITQYVQCQICNLYFQPVPQFKEAVIFNHI